MQASNACHLYPVTIICLQMQGCQNTWGEGLCRAPYLPTQDGPDQKRCFNTYSTCLNKFTKYEDSEGNATTSSRNTTQIEGYLCGVTNYYFSTCEIGSELIAELEQTGVYLGPVVKGAKYNTGILSSEKPLASRSSIQVRFSDFDHNEVGVDPYLETRKWFRINSASNKAPGTFWPRFLARNKNYKNNPMTVYEGDCTFDSLSQFEESRFNLQSISNPDKSGTVILRALDPFDLADDKEAECPRAFEDVTGQPWSLTADIAELQKGSLPLTGLNLYVPEHYNYISYHLGRTAYLCINKEVIEGVLTENVAPPTVGYNFPEWASQGKQIGFRATKRGVLGSEASEHDKGDAVRLALVIPKDTEVTCAISTVMEMCTDIQSAEALCCDDDFRFTNLIDFPLGKDITGTAMKRLFCDVVICDPIKVRKLLAELAEQFGFRIWYDNQKQQVTWKEHRPPDNCSIFHLSECDYVADSFKLTTKAGTRFNQVMFHYNTKDVAEGISKDNFTQQYSLINKDSDNCAEITPKVFYSRWMCEEGRFLMACQAGRLLDEGACDKQEIEVTINKEALSDASMVDQIQQTGFFTIEHWQLQDQCGMVDEEGTNMVWEITQIEPQEDGCTRLIAESTPFKADQCWITELCGEVSECGVATTANDTQTPVRVEGTQYSCACSVY